MDVLFKIEPIEEFTKVLEDILGNLYDLNHIAPNKIFDAALNYTLKEEIKSIILETNLNTNEVSELLSPKHYDQDRVRIFISLLEEKKIQLLNATIVHYNCTFGETLNTFDWKLKMVCGTSDLKTLSYALLQLALHTVNMNHKPGLRLHELNKEMLLKLIGILEENVGDKVINENDH